MKAGKHSHQAQLVADMFREAPNDVQERVLALFAPTSHQHVIDLTPDGEEVHPITAVLAVILSVADISMVAQAYRLSQVARWHGGPCDLNVTGGNN